MSPLVPYRAGSCEAKGKEIAFLLHDCHILLGLELGCAAVGGRGWVQLWMQRLLCSPDLYRMDLGVKLVSIFSN